MKTIEYKQIGIIHSPYKTPEGMPIQPATAHGITGSIELYSEYEEGLSDLSGFSHIILLYNFHLSKGYTLKTQPYLDETRRGVFATRSARRPNPIGISIVGLERIEKTTLHIVNVDIVDGTPLLDIKPHVPDFTRKHGVRIGWLADKFKKL